MNEQAQPLEAADAALLECLLIVGRALGESMDDSIRQAWEASPQTEAEGRIRWVAKAMGWRLQELTISADKAVVLPVPL